MRPTFLPALVPLLTVVVTINILVRPPPSGEEPVLVERSVSSLPVVLVELGEERSRSETSKSRHLLHLCCTVIWTYYRVSILHDADSFNCLKTSVIVSCKKL